MARTVLITGFGPFPGAPFNPTAALAKSLAQRRRPALSGIDRIAHVFPTSYAAVERELPDLIDRHPPDLVPLFGLAPRANARRRSSGNKRRPFTEADLLRAGEAILLALLLTTRVRATASPRLCVFNVPAVSTTDNN